MAKFQKLYNDDESAYLEFWIGEYDDSYDGTMNFNERLLSNPQVRDITTFNTEGNPSTYAVTTFGTEPSHIMGYDGNLLTNESLRAFFGDNTIDIFEISSATYKKKIKGNNGSYPYLQLTKTPASNSLYIDLDLIVGPKTYNHYAIIGLLNVYYPKRTLTNGYGYSQENIASEIYLGLPCSFKNLVKIIRDMGSDRQISLESVNGVFGKWTSTLASSTLTDNHDETVGTLPLRWYSDDFSGNKIYNTASSFIPTSATDPLDEIPEEEYQPNDDDTYTDSDGEQGSGSGPSSLPEGEEIDRIDTPSLSPISLGIYNIYKMTANQFQGFKSNLWNETIMNYLTKIWQSNPMDSILTVALAPFTPQTYDATTIYIGGQTIPNCDGYPLVNSYESFSFTLNYNDKISTVWGNKYDYDGVNYNLFVPFVGFQKLTVNDIYHKNLELNYIIETLTGNGICYLYSKPQTGNFDTLEKARPTYTWSFNCYSKIPLSSRNMDSLVTGVISGVGGALTGNLGGVTTLATARPTIQRSGELKANSSYIGERRPFIVCEYSNLFIKNGQYKKQGRPSWRYTQLSNCSGFTKCKNAQVPADDYITETEQNEINRLLNEGVII